MSNVIQAKGVCKSYHDGALHVDVIRDLEFQLQPGESVAIIGPSGSGKSTLLHLLGGLDKPNKGEIFVGEFNIHALSESKRCELRNQMLGFIYQFHHLLPEFTALENVAMPLLIRGVSINESMAAAKEILSRVGLEKRVQHKLSQLSGGERQRTAIARALVTKPACVLADEPTGNLDQDTAKRVFECMVEIQKEYRTALLIVTHDLSLASKMDRVLMLEHGKLQEVPAHSIMSAVA